MGKCKIIIPELLTDVKSKKSGESLGKLISVSYYKDHKLYYIKNNDTIEHYKINEISLSTNNTVTLESDYNIGDNIGRKFVSHILVESTFKGVLIKYCDLFDDVISNSEMSFSQFNSL